MNLLALLFLILLNVCYYNIKGQTWFVKTNSDSIQFEIQYVIEKRIISVKVSNFKSKSIFVDTVGYSLSMSLDKKFYYIEQKSNTNPHSVKRIFNLKPNASFELIISLNTEQYKNIQITISYFDVKILTNYIMDQVQLQEYIEKPFIDVDRELFYQDSIDFIIQNY